MFHWAKLTAFFLALLLAVPPALAQTILGTDPTGGELGMVTRNIPNTAQGTPTLDAEKLNMIGCVRADTAAVATGVVDNDRVRCSVDATGRIWVHVGQIDGTVTVTGPLTDTELRASPVPISGTVTANAGTGPWPVTDNAGSLTVDAPVGTPANVQVGDGTNTVTIRDLAANDALNVSIVDGAGDQITSFGGGTQYVEGATDASITGTAVMWEDTADTLRAASVALPLPTQISDGTDTVLVTAGGELSVNCGNCTGTGASAVDDTAFTAASDDVAPSGFLYDTTPPSISDGAVGLARMNSTREVMTEVTASVLPTGAATAAGQLADGHNVTANAGTNLNTSALLTTAAHDAALGTAGTADTQVRTVQGIAGMTALTVDGSGVTQPISTASLPLPTGAATEATLASILSGQLPDSHNVTVDNASIAVTGTTFDGIIQDGAGDTTQANVSSGNLHVQQQGSVTVTATALDIRALTNSDIVTAELSTADNTALDVLATPIATISATPLQRVAIFDAADTQITTFGGGQQYTEAETDTTITGTAIMFETNTGTSAIGVVNAGQPLPTQISDGTDTALVTAGGELSVNCGNCTGTGASAIDDTAFTATSDDVAPSGFLFDDSPPSITDGNVGLARMNSSRQILVDLATRLDSTNDEVAIGDGSLTATIRDTGASDSLNVAITDASGNQITSFGGGTEYTEDVATPADPLGKATVLRRRDTPASEVSGAGEWVAQNATTYGAAFVQVVDSSGNFIDSFGGSGGTSAADDADFIAGTTLGTPAMGVYESTPTTITDGDMGVVGITANRELKVAWAQTLDSTNDEVGIGDGTLSATIRDTGSNDSLNVSIVDASGAHITSFGGGTQYAEDTLHVTADTMTLAGVVQQTADTALAGNGDRTLMQVDESGFLKVNIKAGGGSGGTSAADDADFTAGTTLGTPVMGVYESTPTTVTDGDLGAVGITTNRELKVAWAQTLDSTNDEVAIGDGTDTAQVTSTAGGSLQVECAAGCAGGAQFAEDEGSGDADLGTVANVIRDDVLSANAGTTTDLDYTAMRVDNFGSLWGALTADDGARLPADSTAGLKVDLGADNDITGTVTANAGTDLNTSALLTTAAHDAAFGTAGSADAQVRTVQGVASMTPLLVNGSAVTQPVSGTVTADAGTGDFLSIAGHTTNEALKEAMAIAGQLDDAASTAATENNVASVRITSARALHVAQQGTVTVTGTVTADAGTGPWPVTDNAGSLTVDAPLGTPVNVQIGDASNTATIRNLAANDALNVSIVDGAGDQITSFGGGVEYTEDAQAAGDPVGKAVNLIRLDTPATITSLDGDNVAQRGTNYGAAYVQVVTSSGSFVDAFGGSGGTAIADGNAFTPGSTQITPVGGTYRSVLDSVDDNDTGAFAMTQRRAIHASFRLEADGTEIGVAGAPLIVGDGTGAFNVICDSGCAGGTQYTDDTDAHSTGVTIGTAMVAAATPTDGSVDVNDLGVVAMSVDRRLHVDADLTDIAGIATETTLTTRLSATNFSDAFGTAGTADSQVMSVQGIASMTPVQVSQATASSLNAAVVGTGTAGAPAGNILTVQGVASMTKLLVTPDSVALPANQSVDVSQINGITPLMGNGVTGTGSQRVTIASDNTAFAVNATLSAETTKVIGTTRTVGNVGGVMDVVANATAPANILNVGGRFVTTPATLTTGQAGSLQLTAAQNLKTDLSTVAGTATVAASAGVQKVGVSGNIGAAFDAAIGAAPPANALLVAGRASGATGGFMKSITICDTYVNINKTAASTTLLITGISGRHVRICSLSLVAAGAHNVALISGTGATCGTGTTGMNGGTTAASGWNFAANGGITQGSGLGQINQTNATGDSVCIANSAATQLSGRIAYTIY